MILPYRAKNPPEHFPYCTVALIVINVLVWALTSEHFLIIKPEAVEQFAVTHNNLSLWRLTSAMFLHGSLEHIIGNMLFLWIFGASVEGRLRPPKFLLLYFLAGYTGGLLSDFVQGATHPEMPSLGASGAIMGVTGAYLYFFPFSQISIAYWFRFSWGVNDVDARWVVLLYVGMDILFGVFLRGADGVGHFAHLGGFATGLLMCVIYRARRDSQEVSIVQAVRAEMKDYSLLNLNDLETLLQTPTEDMNLVMAYCEKASSFAGGRAQQILAYMNYYGPKLMATQDPNGIANVLLSIPANFGGMPPVFYLRLASRLESISSNDLATQVYRRIYDLNPTAPESEMALYRMGQIMQNAFQNRSAAQASYTETAAALSQRRTFTVRPPRFAATPDGIIFRASCVTKNL